MLKVAVAQMAPVLLDRDGGIAKVVQWIGDAAVQGCQLVVFGEALVPGYPFWLDLTAASRFDDDLQKDIFAAYADAAVTIEHGHLAPVCAVAARHGIAVVLGIIERPTDRSGHSLYCSAVTINADGQIASVHRKLMPTYEERLAWSPGDGHGLVVHPLHGFTLGSLNCWENWMPLARAALYAQGEDCHVALWPGNRRNTEALTPVLAQEGRSFVISVSGVLSRADVPAGHVVSAMLDRAPEVIADGGSCIANPDGSWLIPPAPAGEALLVATLDPREVRRARQNFDPAGHYSRPDVTQLTVNRQRQTTARFVD
ncbi:carbon-nitrogen hydrolase family protein [Sandarakinorhabdus oryzae]|uniref:carbon-nitrogen hydrolase family protein n=1 Tax=Sandarakinorhabdus oryzae TaxID=2675220 RepID=UPI0012E1BDCE|nr:carbon-nitrogen hydrolase family protein [Sandarakinorhabdus oryzae]